MDVRVKTILAGGGVAAAAAAIALISGIDGFWPVAVICAVTTVASACMPGLDRDLKSHPLKLPFFILLAALGLLFVVLGVLSGPDSGIVYGLFMLALTIPAIVVLRRGKNPWWLRGWLDHRRDEQRDR